MSMLRAACGLNCSQCPAFIAHETNDDVLRAKTAIEWNKQYQANFKPEEINCVGCLQEGAHTGYCSMCPIRKCVMDKKVPYCYVCSDFSSCQPRKDFEAQS